MRMYMYELREARVFQNPVALAAGVSEIGDYLICRGEQMEANAKQNY